MPVLIDMLQSWEGGINTAAPADLIGDNVSPYGLNSAFQQLSGEVCAQGKRSGALFVNKDATAISGSPAILGQFQFRRRTGGTTTSLYHLLVNSNGTLDKKLTDNSIVAADAGSPTPFTSGYYLPDAAIMGNRITIVNGQDQMVFDGTDVYQSGIIAPAAPTLTATGVGVMTGTYDVALTYYDSATGLESSRSSSTTQVLAAQQLKVDWVAYAGQHPYTDTKVYIRKQTLQTDFFLAATIAAPVVTTTLNLSDTALNNLIILAPDVAENNPIPDNIVSVATHVSRIFACDLQKVYYSKLDQPEAFDPDNFFTTNSDDGKQLTAVHSAHEVLIVFKRDSMWALYGEDPSTWLVRLVSPDLGCLSPRSIVTVDGVTYWWSEQGPCAWNGSGAPITIGIGRLDPTIDPTFALNAAALDPTPGLSYVGPVAAADIVNQRVLFAVPTINNARNDLILPYSYQLNQWESSGWTLIDAASMAAIEDFSSIPQIYLGGYKGFLFQLSDTTFSDGNNDTSGLNSLTRTHGTVLSATATTLTDVASAGTFNIPLADRWVYIYDSSGVVQQRRRISTNTGTVLTLDSGQTFDPVPTLGNLYAIGAINLEFDTSWRTFGAPFRKKRHEFGYFLMSSTASGGTVYIDLFTDYNTTNPVKTYTLGTSGSGLVWDVGSWDVDVWGGAGLLRARKRLAKVGFVYRFRVRQPTPDIDLTILKLSCRAETLTDKA
jgi:hypothetical protein